VAEPVAKSGQDYS